MADITMSLEDTLELDTIIEESSRASNPLGSVVKDEDGSIHNDKLNGFQHHTVSFKPSEPGTYKIPINGQELTVKVSGKFNVPDSKIFYNFEDNKSDKSIDKSPNSNDGSFIGSPTYTNNSVYGNKALSTDSSSGVNYPDTGVVRPTKNWSVVLFIRDPNLTGSNLRYYWSARENYDIKLIYTNGELGFSYYKGGKASTDGTAIDNDTWHMVTLRNEYKNNKRKISVDTVDYGTNNSFSVKSRDKSNNIGYSAGGNNGNNSVDIDGFFLFDSIINKETEESIYKNSSLS